MTNKGRNKEYKKFKEAKIYIKKTMKCRNKKERTHEEEESK